MAIIMMRLDKYLADMGVGTRTEVKKLIRQGQIAVNGTVVKLPEMKIDIGNSKVTCKGQSVAYETFEYYMLNKPAGVISATTDAKEKTRIIVLNVGIVARRSRAVNDALIKIFAVQNSNGLSAISEAT